ncbi:peptide chain release factor 3 [Loigolactobacillus coryniformis]|jgi:peptide chain release factor 3|uniref:Peptide chain release factor 3 n=3 Tax=Loigolactobacillus coryniformis TaxID=1610 RepID=A0A0R1F5X4_9LACO|nr:peptide chain release factor 3 [Loigolactobacillus coryniformis]MDT3391229.1 peptide chain release factor 3 [Bacillota bacterium]RRG05130.1 MAG: peptide chain release factor 3 [Lactobacillus sp.]ATO42961.1 peptide chain release factor 3 [Loigolactobacillus coryniformis subsp. torquens DSM 20004 = KCTC 3535]ATO54713.1 peptide chain release factor 3 [Loigolactobacillus coryniformis subsp. coryniformis KCTC 3167 = DSM 20001]KRK14474.1 peptide chain release factor 3 [Loigolactobacillus corynifo
MDKKELTTAVDRRRTFAIISHPDAGKTTITEQLLLFGGVIRKAGTVKGKKSGQFAKSDWMEIEKQRGISVTSSVLQFDYQGKRINILDTPGHEDFSEDTYRTLMAVDSAVMVIDAAKGIEPQTKKLFKVCRMRGIPIFTFMNKLDRDGREPMDLIDELEELLDIEAFPMNWPIGMGKGLEGLYDIHKQRVELYHEDANGQRYLPVDEDGQIVGEHPLKKESIYQQALENVQLLLEAGNKFDADKVARGEQTPVFFGSALTNFGVKTFLESYLEYAPAPAAHKTQAGDMVAPTADNFSGFVFKIQANMNPNHRDRIAFIRICSGEFDRGMDVTLQRTQRKLRLANSTEFMADSRESVETAVAGDIVGLYDTGNFQIGDTIYTGKQNIQFENLPQFTPELFVKVTAKNVMKQKSFHKGMEQLVQEGAVQLYRTYTTNDYVLGAVGQLQFEVFQFRMKNEYNSDVVMEPMGEKIARWIDPEQLDEKMSSSRNLLVRDRSGAPLFLFENQFAERWFKQKYPDIKLTEKLSTDTVGA